MCITFYSHFTADKETFQNLRYLSEDALLVNGLAMVSMQFFPSGKYTVQLFHIIGWSPFGDGRGGGRTSSEQARDSVIVNWNKVARHQKLKNSFSLTQIV